MADFTALKAAILAALPENTEGEITATRLVSQLDAIIDALNGAKLDTAQDLEIYDGGGSENTYIKITEYDTGEEFVQLTPLALIIGSEEYNVAISKTRIHIYRHPEDEPEITYDLTFPLKSGTLAIASDYYTKSQVDTRLAKKLDTAEGLTVTDGGGETDSEVELQGHDGGSEKVTLTPGGLAVSDGSALGVTRTDYQLGNIHVQGEEPEDSYDLTLPTKNGTIATTGDVNAKYTMPSGGIPSTDMTTAVQTSLGKANTALQPVQDVSLQTGGVHITGETIDDDALFNVEGLHIYDENGDTHYKRGKILNDSEQINLPSQAGTLALTSQIPDVSGKVNGTGISTIRSISQADYENLGTYDASTLYVIY